MSPEAQQKTRRVSGLVATGGTAALVASMLWQAGVFDAMAERLRGGTPDEKAIEAAVLIADEHAREFVAKEIRPVNEALRAVELQVARMAGALEESNRRRQP